MEITQDNQMLMKIDKNIVSSMEEYCQGEDDLQEETRSTSIGHTGGERGAFKKREFCKKIVNNDFSEKDKEFDKNDLREVASVKQEMIPSFVGKDNFLANCEYRTNIENGNVHIRNTLNNQESSCQPKSAQMLQSSHGRIMSCDWSKVCDICGKSYRRKNLLEDHKRTHTGERPFSCDSCGKTFRRKSNLKEHERIHWTIEPNVCDICQRSFSTKSYLNAHRSVHITGILPFTCDTCGSGFLIKSGLKNHLRTHTGQKPYKCATCDKSFSGRKTLWVHEKTHDPNNHICQSCGKNFLDLTKHMAFECHTSHVCEKCGQNFPKRTDLKNHKKTHQGKVLYLCNVCDKIFPDLKKYTVHSKSYAERRFVCETCGKYFLLGCYLRQHIRMHTGEKPFRCDYCDQAFAKSSNIHAHRRFHTGYKPFACPTCDKKFAQKQHHDIHLRIHTGEKPFMCERCGCGFASSTGLKRHSLAHFGIKNHKCETCGKAFVRRSGLLQHYRVHARDIETGRLKPAKEKEKNVIPNYVIQENTSTS